jgi:hypothetical protein
MWLYPLPAIVACLGFVYILFYRTNSLKQIRYAIVILLMGLLIFAIRSWQRREWPFVEGVGLAAGGPEKT